MRQILAILVIALSITACSLWTEPDSRLLITDSDLTVTPTATVPPPLVLGLQFEETAVLSQFPTQTPLPIIPIIDPIFDPEPFPWFDLMDWDWFALTLP